MSNENVALCCGSHDIIQEEDRQGKTNDARKAFTEFSSSFANASTIKKNERALLCKLADKVYALMLDSTLKSNGESQPGDLGDDEVDRIMNDFIKCDAIEHDALLIVGSHYLMIEFPTNVGPAEEPNWHQRHFWSKAIFLQKRITSYRADKKTLWLYGDIHAPDQIMPQRGSYHVVTGRFGTTISKASEIKRQAKVIRIFDSYDESPNILTIQLESGTHSPQAQNCHWSSVIAEVRSFESVKTTASKEKPYKLVTPDEEKTEKVAPQTVSKIELIDADLEKELMNKIEEKGLYTLGRFHTSEDNISLAWVSIGPLLNSTGVLTSVIKHMSIWLEKILIHNPRCSKDDIVLLGMDCWGAVLVSELSITTGIKNFCVAARGRGVYHTPGELISDAVAEKLRKYKTVVFVCDVLATGHSIKFIYDDIIEKRKTKPDGEVQWLCLSIVMDEENSRRTGCDFIEMYGTTCKNLRMPVVAKNALPSIAILPPKISFS